MKLVPNKKNIFSFNKFSSRKSLSSYAEDISNNIYLIDVINIGKSLVFRPKIMSVNREHVDEGKFTRTVLTKTNF